MEHVPAGWRSVDVDPRHPPSAPPAHAPDQRLLGAALGLGLVALLGAGLFLISTTPRPQLVVAAESSPADDWLAAAASPTAPMVVLVDVAGGVARPGVYELPAGSRVADAVRAAGGFGPLADAAAVTATINLAEAVSD
nr:SLBB domain-containing protein [Chloroflexota bacterium]